uniref:Peptidase S58 family protein n=1 Tax=Thermorudis peleae TaxID=1382356 RepID=A0A831TC40_9BACT
MVKVIEPPFFLDGFLVGHWTHPSGETGCSVVIAERLSPAVAEVRGGAPGTRETALLRPGMLVQRVDAVLLTGGSAFGLAAADGVTRWLAERGRGFRTSVAPVPIVAAAVLFDLTRPDSPRPDAEAGYQAAAVAVANGWASGRIGAGAGARVGKVAGSERSTPAGLGAAKVETPFGAVAVLVAVNAVGDIIDPTTGRILAGTRHESGTGWADSRALLLSGGTSLLSTPSNTTIAVVATDIPVDHDTLTRMAIAAHDGLARAIRPAHTLRDGDTVFVVASREGRPDPHITLAASAATEVAMERAICLSVRAQR